MRVVSLRVFYFFSVALVLSLSRGAASDAVIFRDGFNDSSLSHWRTFGGEWRASDRTLTVSGGRGPRAHVRDVRVSDFELTVDVQISEPGSQAGVVFRASNPEEGVDAYDGYYAGLHCGANQVVWGAVQHNWAGIARKPASVAPGEWYQLKLQVSGENVVLFVNELPVAHGRYPKLDGIDSRFKAGEVGLRALGGEVSFRNSTIREFKRLISNRVLHQPGPGGLC